MATYLTGAALVLAGLCIMTRWLGMWAALGLRSCC